MQPVLIEDGMDHSIGTIGGTGMSAIMGVNPWVSPLDFYLNITGQVADKQSNEAMERGHKYEPVVAEMFQASSKKYTVKRGFDDRDKPCRVSDSEFSFITGSPDRILWKDGKPDAGLEIKTSNIFNMDEWGDSGTNQIPRHYLVQCIHYMGLTGLKQWFLAVLFLNDDEPVSYRSYKIDFDQDTWNAMRDIAVSFWNKYVQTKTPPPLDDGFGQTTIDYYKSRFKFDTEPMAEANEEEKSLLASLIDAKTAVDFAEHNYELLKMKMMEKIGNRSGLYSNLGKITWKKPKDRETVDWKGIVNELSISDDIIKKYTIKKESSRVFLLKPSK